jgi:hypothetical protein
MRRHLPKSTETKVRELEKRVKDLETLMFQLRMEGFIPRNKPNPGMQNPSARLAFSNPSQC